MNSEESENIRLEEICQAAFEDNLEALKNLLTVPINLNQCGRNWTPLHSAIEGESAECVKYLLEKGADVEYQGPNGMGPPLDHALDIAIQSYNNTRRYPDGPPLNIITILLEAGADPATIVQHAERYNFENLMALLHQYLKP